MSNASGAFSLGGLINGTYTLSASDPGYHTQTMQVVIAGGNTVQDVRLSNSSTPPKGNGTNGSVTGFFGSMEGMITLAVVALVVVIVAAALLLGSGEEEARGVIREPRDRKPQLPPRENDLKMARARLRTNGDSAGTTRSGPFRRDSIRRTVQMVAWKSLPGNWP